MIMTDEARQEGPFTRPQTLSQTCCWCTLPARLPPTPPHPALPTHSTPAPTPTHPPTHLALLGRRLFFLRHLLLLLGGSPLPLCLLLGLAVSLLQGGKKETEGEEVSKERGALLALPSPWPCGQPPAIRISKWAKQSRAGTR